MGKSFTPSLNCKALRFGHKICLLVRLSRGTHQPWPPYLLLQLQLRWLDTVTPTVHIRFIHHRDDQLQLLYAVSTTRRFILLQSHIKDSPSHGGDKEHLILWEVKGSGTRYSSTIFLWCWQASTEKSRHDVSTSSLTSTVIFF